MLEPLDEAYQHGYDLRRFSRDLLEHFRNLAVAKVSGGALLPDLADEEAAALRAAGGGASRPRTATAPSASCSRPTRRSARAPYPKLVLEMALLRLAALPPLLPVDELLQRLADLEGAHARRRRRRPRRRRRAPPRRAAPPRARRPQAPRRRQPRRGAAPRGAAAPAASRAGRRSSPSRAASGRRWPSTSPSARRRGSTAQDVAIEAPRGFRADYLSRRDHVAQIEELAGALLRPPHARAGDGRRGGAATRRPSRRAAHGAELTSAALQDPAVQAAVNILGGEIAEVRERRPRRREET